MRYIVKKTKNTSDRDENARKLFRRQRTNKSDQSEIEYTMENWQFQIRRLNYEDAGVYQCSLPLAQPIAKNITLQVIPDLTIEPKTGNFKVDNEIEISCQATVRGHNRRHRSRKHRHHRPTISWYKENDLLKNDGGNNNSSEPRKYSIHNERVDMIFKSTLKVHDATKEDSGKYRCIFENIQEHAAVKVYTEGEYSLKNIQASRFSNNARNPIETSRLFLASCLVAVFYTAFYL